MTKPNDVILMRDDSVPKQFGKKMKQKEKNPYKIDYTKTEKPLRLSD